jgi:flagellar protein FlaG
MMNIYSVNSPPSVSGGNGSGARAEVTTAQRSPETSQAQATAALPERAVADSQKSATVDQEKLKAAVDKANEFIRPFNGSIEFSRVEDTGRMVVKVIDTQTKEVIRQIPSEEMLQISTALDKLKGLLIHNKA